VKRVLADESDLARAAAERIVAIGREALAARGRFDLLLSGGGSPLKTFEALARTGAGAGPGLWAATHFYWSDERCVPPTDPASNYGLARQALLAPLGVPPERTHRIRAEQASPEAAAEEYERICPPAPDLVLMGLGVEGHTASLFPQSPALLEASRRFLAVDVPVAPHRRVTITPAGLAAARRLLVLVSGARKREALAAVFALEGSVAQTPGRLALGGEWFVDRAADG